MRARHGESVLLDARGIACPAAAAAFGFRPLPEGLRSGKGLVGFGIVSDPAVGQRMFEGMSTLAPGRVAALHLFPLDRAGHAPDIVVVEDEVEKLMWLALASLHATGGARVQSSTAVLQATCVDATILPYLEQRMNLSYGCYGCRDATDIGRGEAVLGFPAALLPGIASHVEFLAKKAIPASRSKGAWAALVGVKGDGREDQPDGPHAFSGGGGARQGGPDDVPHVYVLKAPMKIAIGTSLASFVWFALVGALIKLYEGFVNLPAAVAMGLGAAIGAVIGAVLMTKVKTAALKVLFGLIFLYVGLKYLFIVFGIQI
jgi:uncharacterized protein (DUF169 family)